MAYQKINWDYTTTPINPNNLNQMDNAIYNLDNKIDNLGIFKQYNFNNISCMQNTSTKLIEKVLSEGLYIAIAYFGYDGSDLRYFFNVNDASVSGYDNAGVVANNSTTIISVNKNETKKVEVFLWPTNKNVVVSGTLKILRIF